jgi:predicted nucleotidyltransferase component of viral defense system
MLGKLDNPRINISIDIATGDVITPREIEYGYNTLFENKKLNIMAYNLETILAEKFQTIVSRQASNSRMKDFYDIYFLLTNKKELINLKTLKEAIHKTFENRNTEINSIEQVINKIKELKNIKEIWNRYKETHEYAKGVEYDKAVDKLYDLVKIAL